LLTRSFGQRASKDLNTFTIPIGAQAAGRIYLGEIMFRMQNVVNCQDAMDDVRVGSKREELSVSKSRPLYPAKRTSMRGVATSLMGQIQT
jgi:hypothetical protein